MNTIFKATAKKLPEGLQVETTARNFKILLDEPEDLGGTNKGLNPVEAVLSALGACQTICAVSYTHLDVYKRQALRITFNVSREGVSSLSLLTA